MKNISKDPIINSINEGMLRDINICIDNECFRAAIILIFVGIDAMSYMDRPEVSKYNDSTDFKNWIKKYFHVFGETIITPEEWFAARNAIVHTYGAYSKLHKEQNVRVLGYLVKSHTHIRYNSVKSKELILVDILAMRDAFSKGVYSCLTEAFSDSNRKQIMEDRLKELIILYPGNVDEL